MVKTSLIIIPGLGGESSVNKIRWFVNRWQTADRSVYIFESRWHEPETSEAKIERLNMFLAEHKADKYQLVGYSAGGALATAVFKSNPGIEKLVLISAKLKNADRIGPAYQSSAPALVGVVQASELAINKLDSSMLPKIVCLRPIYDEVVAIEDMEIEGAQLKRIPFIFHAPAIVLSLLIFTNRLLK